MNVQEIKQLTKGSHANKDGTKLARIFSVGDKEFEENEANAFAAARTDVPLLVACIRQLSELLGKVQCCCSINECQQTRNFKKIIMEVQKKWGLE